MNRSQRLESWHREETEPFAGWDFSHLDGRMIEEAPPWDYLARAAALMQHASSVVDLDTGGGERLLQLRPDWPACVVATEEFPPNFALAMQRLAPLGVKVLSVHNTEDAPLPFADNEFDLVLNRHAAFNAAEVARMLAPGGVFLTQQVHGLWADDLHAVFGVKPQWPDATPAKHVSRLRAVHLDIVDVQTWEGALRFSDVGAIVYYLKAVPWIVPGFSVDSHADTLFALQAQLDAGGELRYTARKYLIEARKA